MLIEAGRDALVPCGLVVPAAGLGIGLQGADVVELRADRRGARWVGDEEVALFADVGVEARPGGFGAGAEAVREPVGRRRRGVDGGQWRIRFMTMRARLAAPVEQVVREINLFLRGWAGYFRYGNSAHAFDQIRRYALMRLALFIAKRHQRGRAWGFAQIYWLGRRSGSDQPQRDRRRTQAPPGLAGEIEHRR